MAVSSLSSVLPVSFSWSLGTAPETDQRLCLIHSELSRREDRELCDYWTLMSISLIQQCVAVTRQVCYVLCLITWEPVMPAFIDHEGYSCIFHEGRHFVIKKCHRFRCADCLERPGLDNSEMFALVCANPLGFIKCVVREPRRRSNKRALPSA